MSLTIEEIRSRMAPLNAELEAARDILAEAEGGARLIDRLAVDLQPCADLVQSALNLGGDGAVGPRAYIEQQVAILGDDVD